MTEQAELEGLESYKAKINPVTKGTVTWKEDLIFEARTQVGYDFEFDGRVQWGCAPTESLLLSLGGCMGIDVAMFLKKMRVELSSLKVELTGERNPTPPQYYKKIDITVRASGEGLNENKMKRAVKLSHEKYCSVYHSLRKDLEVNVHYVLE
ncbi:MAG: OsmC family protein [Deltaproteobacteria bacterium]|nr:OsmC family protein [Deltaproteobacteria bacterium]